MVNIELFKNLLEQEYKGYIVGGDFIPIELFDLMCKSKIENVKKLFVKQNTLETTPYLLQIRCLDCNKIITIKTNKTKFFDILSFYKKIGSEDNKRICRHILVKNMLYCDDCLRIKQKKAAEENEQSVKNREKIIIENTEKYIDKYLNIECQWNEGVKTWQKINNLKQSFVNENEISDYIKSMDYKDFLQTPYWKAISEKVRQKANFKCQICNSSKNLNVHHRSYQHHGNELYHLEDLICICKDCHEKHHNI